MEVNKKKLTFIFLGVCFCIFLSWVLLKTEDALSVYNGVAKVLSPFVVGAALAFVLNVPMRAIEKWIKPIKKVGLRRALAIVLTLVAIVLVITGVILLLVPQIVETVESLIDTLPDFFERMKGVASTFINDHPELMEILTEYTDFESINWSDLVQKAISVITNSLSSAADYVVSMVVNLSTGIFNAILSLVFCLYCLSRKEILARQARRILYSFVPEKISDEVIRIMRMTNRTFSRFISGQCLEAVILGCLFAVCMAIFKMPFIPLVSVVIAVTALVPILGAFVGCVVGAFFILVQDPLLAVWFVIMFLILQQLENNLIYPRVVGTSIGLPGMWVLVAVAVGGDLMGVGGMLLMIPLASVLYALAREITDKMLKDKNIPAEKLVDQPLDTSSRFKEKRQQRKEARIVARVQRKLIKLQKKEEK